MTDDVEILIKDGIRAHKAQKTDEAFEALSKATELDPYNVQAWLWLSAVVDSEEDKRVCLENVLHIDPDNASAQKGLKMLDAQRPSAPPPAPEPAPAPKAPPPSQPTVATSSSSVFYDDDISGDEFDDWAASLPIGNAQNDAPMVSPFTDVSAFLNDDMDFDEHYDDDPQEDFGDNPFGASQEYAEDEDDVFNDPPSASFRSSSFDTSSDDIEDIDDLRDSNKRATRATRAADRPSTSPRSPVSSPINAKNGGGIFVSETSGASQNTDEVDPGKYYRMIPSEVKATRLPGTGGGLPLLPIFGVLTLLVANAVVLLLLVTR